MINIDYSKITLCPTLNYECCCHGSGTCEYCSNYYTHKDGTCKGCGANFKHKINTKAKFNIDR
jgi:hypothetical protein